MTAAAPTAVALTAERAAAGAASYEISGAPLWRTPAGRLLAPTDLAVRVIDGQVELVLTGVQIDPRTLDPAQPENRISCRLLIELAPAWASAAIDAARGGRHV